MSPNQLALVRYLSGGDFISGEALGNMLGISRAAIWKQLQQLQDFGLEVESVKGLGYRIRGGLDLLDSQMIIGELSPLSRACLQHLHLAPVIDSTNTFLLRALAAGEAASGSACIAEQQTQGKGRRGRQWVSPFARNLYLSLVWEFEEGVAALEGLSLSVGVAAVAALERLGAQDLTLKWPNDLLWNWRKLGGVLLEITGEASGACQVVIGVGLNVQMPASSAIDIDQPWANLAEIVAQPMPKRSRIAGVLLDELVIMLLEFQQQGFTAFRSRWEHYNAHAGRQVTLVTPASSTTGRVLGINEQGALRLSVDNQEQIFLGGEISLRSAE